MTARAFLVRGPLIGLLAGFATFLVAHQVGEPHVETAIALEEAASVGESGEPGEEMDHTHGEEGTTASRHDQRTWGLHTGGLAVGVAIGGIVALIAAAVLGRIGRLHHRRTAVAERRDLAAIL